MFLDRVRFGLKLSLAPAIALALFVAFAGWAWTTLKAQERRLNVDLAAQMHVLQSIQQGSIDLAESHGALYRSLSAVRTNAKPEIVERALKEHKQQLVEAKINLAERVDIDTLDEGGRAQQNSVLAGLQEYAKAAAQAAESVDVDINLAEMMMQGADLKFAALGAAPSQIQPAAKTARGDRAQGSQWGAKPYADNADGGGGGNVFADAVGCRAGEPRSTAASQ